MPRATAEPDNPQLARDAALRLLARREHARLELTHKLLQRGFSEALVEQVVAALAAEDLQSEERFTEAFVHSRRERGQGPVRIQAELRRRQVPDGLIDRFLDWGDPAWAEQARLVCARHFGLEPATEWPDKARRLRFLERRGFTRDQSRAAVK